MTASLPQGPAWGRRLLLALLSGLAGLVAADRMLAWTGRDMDRVAASLYRQDAEPEAYAWSALPALHYRLRPGSWDSPRMRLRVNAQGARGPERSPVAGPVLRILWVGGSSIFGADVNDDDALPARLEAALAPRLDLPVEVWNLGHSGYTASQSLALARVCLDENEGVDLILITITNLGLRPWLDEVEPGHPQLRATLAADPLQWLEILPDPPRLPGLAPSAALRLHWNLLPRSALYRLWRASAAASGPRSTLNPWTAEAERIEARRLGEALASKGVPALFVRWPDRRGSPDGLELRGLSLARPGLPSAHRNLHPSAGVLRSHADHLAEQMLATGLLDADGSLHPERAPDRGP